MNRFLIAGIVLLAFLFLFAGAASISQEPVRFSQPEPVMHPPPQPGYPMYDAPQRTTHMEASS